jgi:tRNA nucleotidyltransferase (CCA-adding enzyme)
MEREMILNKLTNKNIEVLTAIKNADGEAFFVGGCVRDSILGLDPKDFDIEVYGLTSDKLAEVLSPFGADLVGKSFGVFKVGDLDISLPRTDRKVADGHNGIQPGPEMGRIIKEAYNLQLEGTLDVEKFLKGVV